MTLGISPARSPLEPRAGSPGSLPETVLVRGYGGLVVDDVSITRSDPSTTIPGRWSKEGSGASDNQGADQLNTGGAPVILDPVMPAEGTDRSVLPCACGGSIDATYRPVPEAVADHVATRQHRAWRSVREEW